jgi:hypothetical protein
MMRGERQRRNRILPERDLLLEPAAAARAAAHEQFTDPQPGLYQVGAWAGGLGGGNAASV